jgi:hypothetical protein
MKWNWDDQDWVSRCSYNNCLNLEVLECAEDWEVNAYSNNVNMQVTGFATRVLAREGAEKLGEFILSFEHSEELRNG